MIDTIEHYNQMLSR